VWANVSFTIFWPGLTSMSVEMSGSVSAMADRCDLLCLDLPKAERLRAGRLSESAARIFAERARALSDPTRLTLAAALADTDELCVCDLAWVSERAENLVSHHLRALRDAGLVASRREGKMVIYALTDAGRALLTAVSGDVKVRA
jgi:ArsR family transcriptional regulator, lead/cadmium/zinc/bismuth-responsive transcriptional repressor